jgi:hypothetical protein
MAGSQSLAGRESARILKGVTGLKALWRLNVRSPETRKVYSANPEKPVFVPDQGQLKAVEHK